MTRFARAKGSKSSNERIPEKSTPWSAMKQQLLENIDNVKNKEAEKQIYAEKNANYQKFLNEKEEEESKHAVWASFPVQRNKSLLLKNKLELTNRKISNGKNNKDKSINCTSDKIIKKKKLKLVNDKEQAIKCQYSTDQTNLIQPKLPVKTSEINEKTISINRSVETKKQRRKKKGVKNYAKQQENNIQVNDLQKKTDLKQNTGDSKNKKSQNNLVKLTKSDLSETDLQKIEKKKQKRIKQLLKKKEFKEKEKEKTQQFNNLQSKVSNNDESKKKITNVEETNDSLKEASIYHKKSEKLVNKKRKKTEDNHQRRKPQLPHKMFINGKELEIAYIEGFPVKKDAADRLKKLRKEMISKGLPRSQIDMALKLERRKAEKALAREKKKVCFNCRKSGHNLSECPELGKNNIVETTGCGICFKCGSTEHTHFECKVVKGQDYKFAQCFICNEQGHISRQCPDNARGLYPKGGACKVCGDVTHLKKDCPQYQAQQERQENHVIVQTLGDSNPEVLEEAKYNTFTATKKENKIIKFV